MITTTSWTVFATYDDTQEPFVFHVETKDPDTAWKRALLAAEAPIHKAGIVPGKVIPVPERDEEIVPIRGRGHAIRVASIVVAAREVVIPGRCPKCRADTRRTAALVETSHVPRQSFGHLSQNGKDLSAERDARASDGDDVVATTRIACAKCAHAIWDGIRHA